MCGWKFTKNSKYEILQKSVRVVLSLFHTDERICCQDELLVAYRLPISPQNFP